MHPFFYPLGYQIPAYWLMGMTGACVTALFLFLRRRQAGFPAEDALYAGLMAVAGALVGSKLFHFATLIPLIARNLDKVLVEPSLLADVVLSGGVFYGGAIGGALAMLWYCRRYLIPVDKAIVYYTPAVPLFHAFGRVGCFLAGCCWGVEHDHGLVYTQSLAAPNDVPLLPVQLIEAACNLIIFALLLEALRRLKRKQLVLPIYLILYGAARFVLEFYRGDLIRGVAILSTSQWISIVLVAVSLGYLVNAGRKRVSIR